MHDFKGKCKYEKDKIVSPLCHPCHCFRITFSQTLGNMTTPSSEGQISPFNIIYEKRSIRNGRGSGGGLKLECAYLYLKFLST